MKLEHEYFNKSNIDFSKFQQGIQDPQNDKIYSYQSQLPSQLKQKTPQFTKIQTKFYHNKIFHSTHKYEVPIYTYPRKRSENDSYSDFYKTHRKFTKPYGQSTKFTDNLNKNQHLLRRSQFDTPTTTGGFEVNIKSKIKSDRVKKYFKQTSKYLMSQTLQNLQNAKFQHSPKKDLFSKTIKNQYLAYRNLMTKERSKKSERIELNNSMNRLIAAEMIGFQINDLRSKNKTVAI